MMEKECQQCLELLPWYANGSLSAAQAQQVFLHITQCSQCAAELRFLSGLQQHVQADKIATPIPAWSKLQQRLGKQAPVASRSWKRTWIPVTAAAAVVAVIVVRMPQPASEVPAYRLLTSNAAVQTSNSVPSTHEAKLLRVLPVADDGKEIASKLFSSIDAEVVAGPTPRGVYTVALRHDVADRDAFIAALRSNKNVDFVEWVEQP